MLGALPDSVSLTVASPLLSLVHPGWQQTTRTSLPRKLRVEASTPSPRPLLRLAAHQGNSEPPTHITRERLPAGIDRNPVGGVLESPVTNFAFGLMISRRRMRCHSRLAFRSLCVCGQSLRLCTLTPSSRLSFGLVSPLAERHPRPLPPLALRTPLPLGPHLSRCRFSSVHLHL